MSRILEKELYKFTEECKRNASNTSLIRRYIFKPKKQENMEPDGSFYFIDSNKLYDFDDFYYEHLNDNNKENYEKSHPDIRTYFKYNSIAGRFLNKNIRVCDLPVGILEVGECPICRLSKSIDITSRDTDINGNTVYKTTNFKNAYGNIPLDIYGVEYDSNEFLKRTGVLITVYRVSKDNNKPYHANKVSKSNLKICVMSSNYFDISFEDPNPNFSYYIIEICKVAKYDDKESVYTVNFDNADDLGYVHKPDNSITLNNYDSIYYDSKYCKELNISNINRNKNEVSMTITGNNFQKYYIDKSQLTLWVHYDDNNCMLIPTSAITNTVYNNERIIITLELESISVNDNITFTGYYIFDEDISEYTETTINEVIQSYKIEDCYVNPPESDDENYYQNLLDYYPYYLREQLGKQGTTHFGKIASILISDVIKFLPDDDTNDKYSPCISFEVPMKHSSFMLFHHGKLISPYAYFEGIHTIKHRRNGSVTEETVGDYGNIYIYVNIRDLGDEYDNSVKNNEFVVNLEEPIYMIVTDTFFNEDVVYPLIEVEKYIPIEGQLKWYNLDYESDPEKTYQTYVEVTDGVGKYIKYDDNYYEVDSSETYNEYYRLYEEVSDSIFKNCYKIAAIDDFDKGIISQDETLYKKVKTYEYILPVNKRLNKEKISIMVEQMIMVDPDKVESDAMTGLNYAPANNGLYWAVEINGQRRFCKVGNIVDGQYSIEINDVEYTPIMNNNKPILYKRAVYQYSELLNNIKYSTEKAASELFKQNSDGSYESVKPDPELVNEFRKYNDIIKIKIMNGEIIDCGFPNTDEYLNLIDCDYESIIDRDGNQIDYNQNIIDLNSNITNIADGRIVAYDNSNGFSQYHLNGEDEEFLSYPIPNQLMTSEKKLFAFMDGKLTDEFIIDKHLYYRLFDGNTMLAFSDDPIIRDTVEGPEDYKNYRYNPSGKYVFDVDNECYRKDNGSSEDLSLHHYDKIISTIYITNPGNYTLYQDIHGISYDRNSGIFTISNDIDGCVVNEQRMYDDNYMLPFNPKYMILFINGLYIPSDHIQVISNRRFILTDMDDYFELNGKKLTINEMFIYKYEYIKPEHYIDYFEKETINNREVIVHKVEDNLWDLYLNTNIHNVINKYSDKIFKNIVIDPKDPGFHKENTLIGMYEIFGKYVLNKYDIDMLDKTDTALLEEIRSYFDSIYDSDGRLPLELILDNIKRKYMY